MSEMNRMDLIRDRQPETASSRITRRQLGGWLAPLGPAVWLPL